jgi:enoyl-CoA hydratase
MFPDSTVTNIWVGEFIKVHRVENIALVLLDRTVKANAYNQKMLAELEISLKLINKKKDILTIVIMSSSKKYFCAGADLNEISTRSVDEVLNLKSRMVFDQISKMPVVTIALISGDAVGGGLELALACDIRVSTKSGRFWLPETKHGLIPAAGGMERLPHIVGMSWASDLILSGRKLNAIEALQSGLVSRVLDDEVVDKEIINIGREISNRNPLAIKIAKQILQHQIGVFYEKPISLISQAFLTLGAVKK